MSPWICAFLAVFMAFAVSTGDAVKCWECNSERDYACGDPFNYAHFPLIDCDRKGAATQSQSYMGARSVCKKTKQRVNGITIVDRTCAWEQNYGGDPCATSSNNYAYTEHCSVCRYDSCNGAAGMDPAYWALASTVIAYVTVKCL